MTPQKWFIFRLINYKNEIRKDIEMANTLDKFKKSYKSIENLLSSQKTFGDRTGLGYDSYKCSTSKSKQIKILKPLRRI